MTWDLETFCNLLKNDKIRIELKDFDFFLPIFIVSILCIPESDIYIITNCEDQRTHTYLNRLNFYKILGVSVPVIHRHPAQTFLEITPIDNSLSDTMIENFRKKMISNLWISVNKKDEGKAYSINFFLAELIRNVTNHARLEVNNWKAFFMFQTYKRSNTVNLAIVDNGIWIQQSFRESPFWNSAKGIDYYINLAFERWKTSNSNIGAWNGLYFSKELVKLTNSKLSFLSGNMLYEIEWENETYQTLDNVWWAGVIIDLHINIDSIDTVKVLELFNGIYPWYLEEYDELDDIFS